MTGNATDGHIDQLVKARWLAIGLSQSDLAEVLGAAIKQSPADVDASRAAAGRLMQIADALGFPANFVRSSVETRQELSKRPDKALGKTIRRNKAAVRCNRCLICACCGRFVNCTIIAASGC